MRVPAAEFAVLNGAEAVDLLVLFEEKTLSEFVGVALHRAGAVFEGEGFFRQQEFALRVVETERKGLRIEFDLNLAARNRILLLCKFHVLRNSRNHKAFPIGSFSCRIFGYSHNFGSVEFGFYARLFRLPNLAALRHKSRRNEAHAGRDK